MGFTVSLVEPGLIEVKEDGEVVAVYRYSLKLSKPYFYPLNAPRGLTLTRDKPPDHIHHRSFWTAHGDVNGVDFWGEAEDSGRIECREPPRMVLEDDRCLLSSVNRWVSRCGTPILEERRSIVFWRSTGEARFLDYEVFFEACYGDVVFGDTKEGGIISVRVADSMRESIGGGEIRNSEGGVGEPRCWGRRARWCDYTGRVDGGVAGVTIFDHPDNPRHPTYWHVRAYGLFAANCFGISYFERDPRLDGSLRLAKGGTLTFKYRVYLHLGRIDPGEIEEHYRRYAEGKPPI